MARANALERAYEGPRNVSELRYWRSTLARGLPIMTLLDSGAKWSNSMRTLIGAGGAAQKSNHLALRRTRASSGSLGRNEPHVGPGDRFPDGLGVK